MEGSKLKQWQCHKRVRGFKIGFITTTPSGEGVTYKINESAGDDCVFVDQEYLDRCRPAPGGYYILYEDGYESYAPFAAFENGYAVVDPNVDENPFSAVIFMFNQLQIEIHTNAKQKGWWDVERNDGELICLMHAELSEALEALRDGNPPGEHIPEFTGVEEEMADTVIRIMDFCQARGHRLGSAILAKMEMNRGRERMHGGKMF